MDCRVRNRLYLKHNNTFIGTYRKLTKYNKSLCATLNNRKYELINYTVNLSNDVYQSMQSPKDRCT